MRFAMRSMGILSAVWLFSVLVIGVSAQGGALNGYIWDGSSFLPEVAAALAPAELPASGAPGQNWAALNGYVWDGSAFLPEVAASLAPVELPASGASGQGRAPLNGYIWDGSAFLPEVAAYLLP
jgi:hypothetical protein